MRSLYEAEIEQTGLLLATLFDYELRELFSETSIAFQLTARHYEYIPEYAQAAVWQHDD